MDTTDIDNEQFYVALFLSTIAGLSTVIGGFGVFFVHPLDSGVDLV